eukprot:CAMPEP_0175059946 /NCGR_PEP_ID=MMETSP0052_2-20121109/12719_1 /TAXON_ID=51329 ORGANISM="Polytomella parva, Strain SAG 63-3" /NCGR_SAMPLE_ID=MMETSP0052_2 /ASSEMBLY_ACC=CAM_ASM_000194 /LENGTH=463 /DNA_ID=CAMNT_0016325561 /DNA_START=142 /DNA_END=1530 /DNA_ORIENTATION=+
MSAAIAFSPAELQLQRKFQAFVNRKEAEEGLRQNPSKGGLGARQAIVSTLKNSENLSKTSNANKIVSFSSSSIRSGQINMKNAGAEIGPFTESYTSSRFGVSTSSSEALGIHNTEMSARERALLLLKAQQNKQQQQSSSSSSTTSKGVLRSIHRPPSAPSSSEACQIQSSSNLKEGKDGKDSLNLEEDSNALTTEANATLLALANTFPSGSSPPGSSPPGSSSSSLLLSASPSSSALPFRHVSKKPRIDSVVGGVDSLASGSNTGNGLSDPSSVTDNYEDKSSGAYFFGYSMDDVDPDNSLPSPGNFGGYNANSHHHNNSSKTFSGQYHATSFNQYHPRHSHHYHHRLNSNSNSFNSDISNAESNLGSSYSPRPLQPQHQQPHHHHHHHHHHHNHHHHHHQSGRRNSNISNNVSNPISSNSSISSSAKNTAGTINGSVYRDLDEPVSIMQSYHSSSLVRNASN